MRALSSWEANVRVLFPLSFSYGAESDLSPPILLFRIPGEKSLLAFRILGGSCPRELRKIGSWQPCPCSHICYHRLPSCGPTVRVSGPPDRKYVGAGHFMRTRAFICTHPLPHQHLALLALMILAQWEGSPGYLSCKRGEKQMPSETP